MANGIVPTVLTTGVQAVKEDQQRHGQIIQMQRYKYGNFYISIMWDKMQFGVFLIFTGFFMPVGIILCIMARSNNKKNKRNLDMFKQKTFINSSDTRDKYEQRYY